MKIARQLAQGRGYDRTRILARAERARRRGRTRKALGLYQRVLDQEPENADLYRRVAPLLVRRGEQDEAWKCYRVAAELLVARGFEAQACGVLREAADSMPKRLDIWVELAERIRGRDRTVDAWKLLLEGRGHFRGRRQRSEAIALLRRAYALDPDDITVGLDLARQLARKGDRAPARRLLERLEGAHPGRRRRLRFEIFRVARDGGTLLAWVRTLGERRALGAGAPSRPLAGQQVRPRGVEGRRRELLRASRPPPAPAAARAR